MADPEQALADALCEAGVGSALASRLAAYGALLLEVNRRINLTGARDARALLPHLLDSLTPAPYLRGRLVDIGSGGGLPAIPLALATGVEITLIEATAKKATFLERVLSELGLPGRIVPRRAEVAGRDTALRERFTSGTARAIAGGPTVLELLLPLLEVGGLAVLQRGSLDAAERAATGDASLVLGGVVEDEVALEGERRLLLVRKVAPTPARFPRRTGIPQKRPLCS